MVAVPGIDQLSRDPKPVIDFADAPFQHITHPQLPADLPHVGFFILKGKRRGAANHLQALHLGQHIEDLLCQAVAEIFLGHRG